MPLNCAKPLKGTYTSEYHSQASYMASFWAAMSPITFRRELETFLYQSMFLTMEPTQLIIPSPEIPLRLRKVPLQHFCDNVTLLHTFNKWSKQFDKKTASLKHVDGSMVFTRWGQYAPHLIHASLGLSESTTQKASQSVQPFLHSSWQSVIRHVAC